MKYYLLLVMLAANAFCGDPKIGGGFVSSEPPKVTSVSEAKKQRDNTFVVVQGVLKKYLGDEKYWFSDSSDSIIVEIDQEIWAGQTVSDKDTVQIYGEVDKEGFRREIDAEKVVLIKK